MGYNFGHEFKINDHTGKFFQSKTWARILVMNLR